jgi:riboflavin-specific deaminase-like protein
MTTQIEPPPYAEGSEILWHHLRHRCGRGRQPTGESAGERAADLPADDTAAAEVLHRRYAPVIAAGLRSPRVIAQLGQSLDGRIATAAGHSHYVTGAADRAHLHRLRALSDAVVVGAGTLRTDDPALTVRAVAGVNPTRVVLSDRRGVSGDAQIFRDGQAPTWLMGPAQNLPVGLDRHCRVDVGDPNAVFEALAQAGFGRVLIEGGARTVSAWVAAGLVDVLYLTVAPVIIGAGPTGLELPPIARMDDALRPRVERFAMGEDMTFCLDFSGVAE